MDLSKSHAFLVLQRPSSKKHQQVRILTSLSEVLNSWTASTRLSPIWGVKEFGTSDPVPCSFDEKNWLLLLGPVHPESVLVACSHDTRIWLSLGLFNVIIAPKDDKERSKIRAWARKNKTHFEEWHVFNGDLLKVKSSKHADQTEWRASIEEVASLDLKAEVSHAASEYCAVMATALGRSPFAANVPYLDLLRINEHVKIKLQQAEDGADEDSPYRTFGQLLDINMGLGRFVSQTFAGTPLISDTECHFRYNSLLGIGVATLGIWKLRAYVQSKLGGERITEKFAELGHLPYVSSLSSLDINDEFWWKDHLSEVTLDSKEREVVVPLLSYFSARDGFRSTSTTISVPLAAVSACNSMQWSLTTFTHEVSHIIIHNILFYIYPRLSNSAEVNDVRLLVETRRAPSNLLEEIQRYVLLAIIAMYTIRLKRFQLTNDTLIEILQQSFNEVEEILVHVFDYIYFYGMSPSKYIRGIWASWGTIPNINTRVHEYVTRTICAVLAGNLRRSIPEEGISAEDISKEQVLNGLKELKEEGASGTYVSYAIDYIERSWDSEIREAVQTRRHLVKVVRTFLFSEQAAYSLRQEVSIRGKTGEKEGYGLKKGRLEESYIMNPLRFIEFYTDAKHPSSSDSAWIYYILAFCIENDELGTA